MRCVKIFSFAYAIEIRGEGTELKRGRIEKSFVYFELEIYDAKRSIGIDDTRH